MGTNSELEDGTNQEVSNKCITSTDTSVNHYVISDSAHQYSNEMNLSGRRLKLLPDTIFNYNYLISLNISNNDLHCLPEHIGNLKNLMHLNVSHNELQNLPRTLSQLVQLKHLNLSHNKFVCVPFVIYDSLQFLRLLNLSHNAISDFRNHPHCVFSLSQLNLSHNKLDVIPKWVFDSKCKIEELDISYNPLTKVDRHFMSGCMVPPFKSSIKELNIQNCKITFHDLNFIMHMTDLKKLKLGNDYDEAGNNFNCVEQVNMELLKNCKSLEALLLSNVGLSLLPTQFDLFKNLQHLDLSNNYLTWLPDDFCNLHSLQVCMLSSNSLHFLPEKFGQLINLRELYLSHNNLSSIPESCKYLSNLEYFDLYSNKLESISLEIIDLTSLKGIDLERNSLDFLEVCSQDQEKCKSVYSKYSALRLYLRQVTDTAKNRCDEQNLMQNETHTQESDVLSVISSCELDYYEPNPLCNTTDEGYSENWDDDSDTNDVSRPVLTSRERRLNDMFRGNFCPGDYHAPSLSGLFLKKVDEEFVEAEFLFTCNELRLMPLLEVFPKNVAWPFLAERNEKSE